MAVLIVALGITLLLYMVLQLRMPAYLALLLASIGVGLGTGMQPAAVVASIQSGMGSTLGFVAVVVGLGAMLGGLLEAAGGVQIIARRLLQFTGTYRAPWALTMVGFVVAIPVFFDVAFIILVPMLYSLARASRKSILYFAMPTLAGLMVTHAFIPPTPGPIAVAELLGADLGKVILFGALAGIPAVLIAGPLYGQRFASLPAEPFLFLESEHHSPKSVRDAGEVPFSFALALGLLGLPLLLILSATFSQQWLAPSVLQQMLGFFGHPFVALLLATLLAWWQLRRRGMDKGALQTLMTRTLEPAGVVVLVTGAGGVFKQILSDSGAGQALAEAMAALALSVYVFAFVASLLVRIAQGSATVAMITAAGLVAPLLAVTGGDIEPALVVIAIAAGATSTSHVNDSGFWLVSRYLHLDEANTLKTWTVVSTIAGFSGFAVVLLMAWMIG